MEATSSKKGFTPTLMRERGGVGRGINALYMNTRLSCDRNTARTKTPSLVRGFTLLELLIVIGILAILASVTVLVLNPAQLLAQARDSRRISDTEAISRALNYYLANTTSPDLGDPAKCYVYVAGLAANCGGRHAAGRVTTVDATREPDGNGWIPVNFSGVSGGSPLSVLPIDPKGIADTTYYFSYANTNSRTFELDANMESAKYVNGGPNDVESTDGGNNPDLYELGNDPTFAL